MTDTLQQYLTVSHVKIRNGPVIYIAQSPYSITSHPKALWFDDSELIGNWTTPREIPVPKNFDHTKINFWVTMAQQKVLGSTMNAHSAAVDANNQEAKTICNIALQGILNTYFGRFGDTIFHGYRWLDFDNKSTNPTLAKLVRWIGVDLAAMPFALILDNKSDMI